MSSKGSEQTDDASEDLPSFEDVYEDDPCETKNLIYGNGFSVGLYSCFSYDSLYCPILNRLDPELRAKIEQLSENDEKDVEGLFLTVWRLAESEAESAGLKDMDLGGNISEETIKEMSDAISKVTNYASDLRRELPKAFAEVLVELHEDIQESIPDSKLEAAGSFLERFDSIFTLNYDLLWRVAKDGSASFPDPLPMHGSIHLVSTQGERFYFESQPAVIDDIDRVNLSDVEEALNEIRMVVQREDGKKYPLVVIGDTHLQKEARIELLDDVLGRSTLGRLESLSGSLYTFGWSMHPGQDEHILKAITEASELDRLNIGIYSPKKAQKYLELAERINERRLAADLKELEVCLYGSSNVLEPD